MTRAVVAAVILLTLGCSDGRTDRYQGAGDGGAPPDGAWAEDASVSPTELAVCDEPPGPRRYVADPGELHGLLVGRWASCQGAYLDLGVPAMAGIEFGAEGTYWVLVSDAGGGLTRATGADASGTWDTLMSYETSFNLPSGAWAGYFTFIEEEPRRVSLGSGLDDLRWFVADREDSVEDVAGRCAAAPGPSHPVSDAEATTIPVARWAYCEGTRPVEWPADAVAMELTDAGRLYGLRRTNRGALVRGVGVLYEGEWSASSGLVPGTVSLCVGMPTGAGCFNTTFTDDPRGMNMGDADAYVQARWVALP
jgi:hypothetical protein